MGMLALKRTTDAPSPADGIRVLVDRRWPPGVSRDAAAVDLWLKEAAPSEALRRWYARDPARRAEFRARYRAEIERREGILRMLQELRRRGSLTLLHAARDAVHTNA